MKWIRTFEEKDILLPESWVDISKYIREEINLGNAKSYDIEHNLYKSGDYICSSFKIDNRDVIVSSIVISDNDTKCIRGSKHYNTLSDILFQFGINPNEYLYIGFGEYLNGVYNYNKNVNDVTTLFKKMNTIINIIENMVKYHSVDYIILNSIENDIESGLNISYKKRDKFYELYLAYHTIKYFKINHRIDINGEIIQDFYLLVL